jgi:hypothetical protein
MTTKTFELSRRNKRLFDINSETDIELYREYLINNGWGKGGCPFIIEYPFNGVPEMINFKLIRKFLGVKDRTVSEGAA